MNVPRELIEDAISRLKSCMSVPHWPVLIPTIRELESVLAVYDEMIEKRRKQDAFDTLPDDYETGDY